MTPIYNASTLHEVSTTAQLAAFNRVHNDYLPKILCKINEANFSAANEGQNFSTNIFNLFAMGLSTEEMQNYLRVGLETELKTLGFEVYICMFGNDLIRIKCKW